MKNFAKVLLSAFILAAPLVACGSAKAEPCGARCMMTTTPTTEPTTVATPTK